MAKLLLRQQGAGPAAGERKQLVSHNGIVGSNMRKVQEFSVPFPARLASGRVPRFFRIKLIGR